MYDMNKGDYRTFVYDNITKLELNGNEKRVRYRRIQKELDAAETSEQRREIYGRELEFIEFCAKYGQEMLPWQEWLSEQTLRLKPDGRWQTPVNGILIARQNGKSTWMAWQILWRIFGLEQKLQVHTAHKLTTSAEVFYKIYGIITEHPELESQLVKKLEARGFQELQFSGGRRYIVRASNSATRGIAAPDTIWLDEAREYHDEDVWSSLRFTQMASANPQAFLLSNAGDQHSIVLNKMRERALASILTNDLVLGWWEWIQDQARRFGFKPEVNEFETVEYDDVAFTDVLASVGETPIEYSDSALDKGANR